MTAVEERHRTRRVLFVDDEPHLLAGLRRMFRSHRDSWDLSFASSGVEALNLIEAQPVDAIVCDMRMPGMDGAELLALVQRDYPATARIILSGEADRSSVVTAIRYAQQFLTKPCDADTLTAAIERSLEVSAMLADPALRELVGGVTSLPSLPVVYQELLVAMDSPDVAQSTVSRILSNDVATCAEVLKLVNSAFFGLARKISTVQAAVSMLGLDNIQALVLAGSVFRVDDAIARLVDVEQLRAAALQRAAIARLIAARESWPQHERNLAALACMLRDVGELVLAEGRPEAAAELGSAIRSELRLANEGGPVGVVGPVRRAELELAAYRCTVPQASAYLLGLWNFAPVVVHAVASQPLVDPGPATTHFEHIVNFAHLRVLDPGGTVTLAPNSHLTAERLRAWNAAADEVTSP